MQALHREQTVMPSELMTNAITDLQIYMRRRINLPNNNAKTNNLKNLNKKTNKDLLNTYKFSPQPLDHSILQAASPRACSLQARRLQWSSSLQARVLVFHSPSVSGHKAGEGWQKAGRRLAEGWQKADSASWLPTAVLTAQRLFCEQLSQLSGRSGSSAAVLPAQWPIWQLSGRLAAQQPIWQLSSRSGSSAADLAAQPPI